MVGLGGSGLVETVRGRQVLVLLRSTFVRCQDLCEYPIYILRHVRVSCDLKSEWLGIHVRHSESMINRGQHTAHGQYDQR